MPSGVITLGETMGLITPRGRGRLRHCHDADLGIGGAESNLAIGVARLGHRSTWIGRVGDDPWGALVLDELRAERVDVSYVRVDATRPTAVMLKHRALDGSMSVTYLRRESAGSALTPDDIPASGIANSRILHLTGITPALSPSAAAATRKAVSIAHASGCRVSLDLNYRSRLWSTDRAAPALRELAANADIVFAGDDEARFVIGETDPEAACRAIAQLGPTHVVVKRGSAGATALIEDALHDVPPFPVRAIDPVGAGDAFAAAYLAGLLEALAPREALALAAKAGAYAVGSTGDWESFPDRALLDRGTPSADVVVR